MRMFIWQQVGGLTNRYHDDGSVAVVAENLDAARLRLANEPGVRIVFEKTGHGEEIPICQALTDPPDAEYELVGATEERVFIFPDAGCC